MSFRFLKRAEIDSEKWDDCIMQSPYGQVFFMSWYLDACCSDWSALIKGDYQSVFPLAAKKKFGISYLYQPFFTRHFGMITKDNFNPEEAQEFLDAFPDKFKYIDICLHLHHTAAIGFRTSAKTYQTRDMRAELIGQGYSDNLHRLLKKARGAGLQLVQAVSPEHIVDSFRLHQTQIRDQFKEADYSRLTGLMHAAIAHTDTQAIAVRNSTGQPLAGAFFLGHKDTLLYLKGFSTEGGRKLGAMHFLFDQVIQSNSGRYSKLDFGGSSVPGVARFYRHFGATDSLYLRIRSNRLPRALQWIKNEPS